MINFLCAGCNCHLRVTPDKAGKTARCPRCGTVGRIPQESAFSEAEILPETLSRAPAPAGDATPPPDPAATATFQSEGQRLPMPATGELIQVAGYEVLEELGRGGMGVIYKARQLSPRRLVALKMILSGEFAGIEQQARFRAEAEAVARLQHPNIVQIHEIGEHQGRPYLTLEYVDGGNLAQLQQHQRLSPRRAARLVQELAHAVQYAHKRGILHRDLKPANVLLAIRSEPEEADLPWIPKIADFGLAKQMEGSTSMAPAGPITQSGAILGTPAYMAPEQVQGKSKELGPAVDVYALGAILYELLTGRPPFQGESALDILMKVANEEPELPSRIRPKIPRDLETICLKCLHKEPARRYASAKELADDLGRFLDGEAIAARPHGRMERVARFLKKRKELTYSLGGAALVLFLGLVLLAMWSPFGSQGPAKGNMPVVLPADLKLVPPDALAFVCLHMSEVFEKQDPWQWAGLAPSDIIRDLPKVKEFLQNVESDLSLTPRDVERVSVVTLPDKFRSTVFLVTFSKPYRAAKLQMLLAKHNLFFSETKHKGRTVYWPMQKWSGPALCPISDTVLLFGSEEGVKAFLDRSATLKGKGPLSPALELAAANHLLVVGLNPGTEEKANLLNFLQQTRVEPLLQLRSAILTVDFPEGTEPGKMLTGLNAELKLAFADESQARAGKVAAQAAVKELFKFFDQMPNKQMPALVQNHLLAPLHAVSWQQEGNLVHLEVRWQWSAGDLEVFLKEMKAKGEKEAVRLQSQNKLKQLGIAMHTWHDIHKKFPPAAITDPRTGKKLLSWRVALLPYLEQNELYQQFLLNQPWDHEHNLKLLEKMPAIFEAPLLPGTKPPAKKNTTTFYQVLVGPGTVFEEGKNVTLGSIPDGTSNTLMIVEAAASVPWTKPEDVIFDEGLLLPKLGGIFPDGFNAVTADGAAHFFPNTVSEEKTLRPLAIRNSGIPFIFP